MKMSEWCNLTPAVRCHAVNTPFMPSLLRKLQPIFFLEGGGGTVEITAFTGGLATWSKSFV